MPFLRLRWKHYIGLLRALGDVLTIKYFLVPGKLQGPNFVFVLYPILIVFLVGFWFYIFEVESGICHGEYVELRGPFLSLHGLG